MPVIRAEAIKQVLPADGADHGHWLVTGIILIAVGALVLGPGDQPSAEISRWIGIIAADLGAISAMFFVHTTQSGPLSPSSSSMVVIYRLSAHYEERAKKEADSRGAACAVTDTDCS
jgi:hypothetical protein